MGEVFNHCKFYLLKCQPVIKPNDVIIREIGNNKASQLEKPIGVLLQDYYEMC